ncbi:MAG: DUF3137 domain-containing protein [Bacilli bacterium]|nr:DUF3137 domain-containing protein [Bacilli bacterium]
MNIEELEKSREKVVKKKKIGYGIAAIVSLGFVFINYMFNGVLEFDTVFITGFLGVLLTSVLTMKDYREFVKGYKKVVVLEIFKTIFKNIHFDLDRGIPEEIISNTGMMDTGDIYHSNDYICAKYKNVSFEFSDVEIEEEHTDSDGDRHRVTVFKGQWYIFDFNKQFKADLQVCEKGFRNAKLGGLFSFKKFNKVQLEDIEFNKEFNVFAQNNLDAFYVLTPNTMEKIKKLNNSVHGKLLFCFIDNKLHVGLHSGKDLFEPNLYKKINIEQNHKQAIEEIQMITNFVDILGLDNDLFRKGV